MLAVTVCRATECWSFDEAVRSAHSGAVGTGSVVVPSGGGQLRGRAGETQSSVVGYREPLCMQAESVATVTAVVLELSAATGFVQIGHERFGTPFHVGETQSGVEEYFRDVMVLFVHVGFEDEVEELVARDGSDGGEIAPHLGNLVEVIEMGNSDTVAEQSTHNLSGFGGICVWAVMHHFDAEGREAGGDRLFRRGSLATPVEDVVYTVSVKRSKHGGFPLLKFSFEKRDVSRFVEVDCHGGLRGSGVAQTDTGADCGEYAHVEEGEFSVE